MYMLCLANADQHWICLNILRILLLGWLLHSD